MLLAGYIIILPILLGLSVWFIDRTKKWRVISRLLFNGELVILEGLMMALLDTPNQFSYRGLSTAIKDFSETKILGTDDFRSIYRVP